MADRNNKRVRRERYQRNLERDIQDHQDPPSSGMYCVVDKKTKEKHKGLSLKQATALWNTLESAIILQDEHVRRNG